MKDRYALAQARWHIKRMRYWFHCANAAQFESTRMVYAHWALHNARAANRWRTISLTTS